MSLSIFLLTSVNLHMWIGGRIQGFVNESQDVKLDLMEGRYLLAIGHPLSLPREKRHVDFQEGEIAYSEDGLILLPGKLFMSPGRWGLEALLGVSGYVRQFPTQEARWRWRIERRWRYSIGTRRKVTFTGTVVSPALSLDGVPLIKNPNPELYPDG
jgi:hypothetical protein